MFEYIPFLIRFDASTCECSREVQQCIRTDFVENVTFFQNAITRRLGGVRSCASDMLQGGVAFLVFEICCTGMLPYL